MRHRTAAQLGEGGGWHYVEMGRDCGHPIGYCADHEPHPTEQEARECRSRFLREQTIRLNDGMVGWTACRYRDDTGRCPEPTQTWAAWGDDGYGGAPLCARHQTVEAVVVVAGLDRPAGDCWVS